MEQNENKNVETAEATQVSHEETRKKLKKQRVRQIIASLIELSLQSHPSRLLVIKLTTDIIADLQILLGQKAVHLLLLKGQTQNIQKPTLTKWKGLGLVLDFSMQIFVNQVFETQNLFLLIQLPEMKAHIFTKIDKILL